MNISTRKYHIKRKLYLHHDKGSIKTYLSPIFFLQSLFYLDVKHAVGVDGHAGGFLIVQGRTVVSAEQK